MELDTPRQLFTSGLNRLLGKFTYVDQLLKTRVAEHPSNVERACFFQLKPTGVCAATWFWNMAIGKSGRDDVEPHVKSFMQRQPLAHSINVSLNLDPFGHRVLN